MVPLRVKVGSSQRDKNRRRVELLLEDPATAANDRGALVIDETVENVRRARRPPT